MDEKYDTIYSVVKSFDLLNSEISSSSSINEFDNENFENVYLLSMYQNKVPKTVIVNLLNNKIIHTMNYCYRLNQNYNHIPILTNASANNKLYYGGNGIFLEIIHKDDTININKFMLSKDENNLTIYNVINTQKMTIKRNTNPTTGNENKLSISFTNDYVIVSDNEDVQICNMDDNTIELFNKYQCHYYPHNINGSILLKKNIVIITSESEFIFYNLLTKEAKRTSKYSDGQLYTVSFLIGSNSNIICANFVKGTFNKSIIYKVTDDEIADEDKCSICYNYTEKQNILVPCGHTQYCTKCITDLTKCAICRADVTQVMKIFK